MPSDDARERSASPSREPRPKKQKSSGGFKWKEKRPRDDEATERKNDGRLERGYRDRSPLRDTHKNDTDPPRPRSRSPRQPTTTITDSSTPREDPSANPPRKEKKPKKPKPPSSSSSAAAVSSQPMIVVNVNDRLGTKAAIPCLASDSVKAFKAMVAAHIGRQPHEILLKRQGQRPFKDALTLADYEVSNGVQLDLELDTGD